jgi:hypothetical protein
MNLWGTIVASVGRVPADVWMLLVVVNLVATVLTWSGAGRRMRRAGERAADPQLVAGGAARTRDTALTVASMIPAVLFWAMVLAGSFHGLVSFGRSVLGWHAGWEYLVPGTLDGVSVTFAFLAFRAVRMKKAPDRCYRVVWGSAVASATVNFAYEYTHSGHCSTPDTPSGACLSRMPRRRFSGSTRSCSVPTPFACTTRWWRPPGRCWQPG